MASDCETGREMWEIADPAYALQVKRYYDRAKGLEGVLDGVAGETLLEKLLLREVRELCQELRMAANSIALATSTFPRRFEEPASTP